ncbi:MAG: response regulator [Chitinophagaceae bacterium]|nr:MAG: response regulator [Chitinophagaceae bacterium]
MLINNGFHFNREVGFPACHLLTTSMHNFSENPIILVDDDEDDLEIAAEAIISLGYTNEIIKCNSGQSLISKLHTPIEVPFLIICDLNLPGKDGIEVRKMLVSSDEVKYKTIPFVLWSTGATDAQIRQSFDLWAQGIFEKPASFDKVKLLFSIIMEYWRLSGHPQRRQGH